MMLSLGSVPGFPQASTVPFAERKADGFASYTVVIPATEFNKESLIHIADEYLVRNEKLELMQVGIFTDKQQAQDFGGKGVSHFSYDTWKTEVEKRKEEQKQGAAVLLKYGIGAALRIKYSDGRIEELVISGQDAFHPRLDNVTARLLQVSFVDQGFGKSKQLTPHFYLVIPSKISAEQATALAKSFISIVRIPRIEIHLREDEWFIFDSHYPWINPFTQTVVPATEADAAKSIEFLCRSPEKEPCYESSSGIKRSP
jgi:hypothetical protein